MKTIQKKGQVWIETVLYTLIALVMIGMVLGFVMPKINQSKDKLTIEQTVDFLTLLNDKIDRTSETAGNVRLFEFTIKRGELAIIPSNNTIVFTISGLSKPYSEPGIIISRGPVQILSKTGQKESTVYLTLDYSSRSYNIMFDGSKENKKFTSASVPYKINIINNGTDTNGISLDIEELN